MFCKKCGGQMPQDAPFCGNCGTPVGATVGPSPADTQGMPQIMYAYFNDKRSVGLAIVFSIITCSIYAWYWLYQMLSTLYRMTNQPNQAGMDIVLSIVTFGIYYIYVHYKMGQMEAQIHRNHGMPPRDNAILYLILVIFGLWIVNFALVQSGINNLPEGTGGTGFAGPSQYGSGNQF